MLDAECNSMYQLPHVAIQTLQHHDDILYEGTVRAREVTILRTVGNAIRQADVHILMSM